MSRIEQILREKLGPVGCMLAKSLLRGIKIEFDIEQKQVRIISDGKTQVIEIDEIQQFLTELSQ